MGQPGIFIETVTQDTEPTSIRYTYGFSDGGQWSVLRVTDEDTRNAEAVLAGDDLTEAKVKAVALILNAPELY